ncbi:DotH/IcmK family type IV secretion protein [Cupriavidus sp. BIC8F]|uniref:DotH/IcmK family type IV secretion protein n=1 Tax=Cupriavidus sp. BIC8F TaxID=3079014 RepID=UPI002915C65B|nr:DotH/IcmK family type IV secretion protein [Cupriavidus sp. BIC8F]
MHLSLPRLYALLILSISTACGQAAAQGSPGEPNKAGAPSSTAAVDDANAPRALPPLKPPPVGSANFNSAVDTISPLTSTEILDLRKRVDSARRAASTYPGVPPKPVISTTTVDLSPGSTPPIVRVSNQGAAVSMVDITGAPWDILEVNNLGKRYFEVKQPAKDVPTITITALGDYVEGNVAIFLKGLSIPVMLRMVAGQRETDYRLDLRIPRRGPNAIDPIAGTPSINLPANYLQTLLDGTDTPNAKPIRVENAPPGTRAWMVGGNVVLRTTLFLNNPAYQATIAAADGTRVYELAPTPVATLSENGSLRNVYLELE